MELSSADRAPAAGIASASTHDLASPEACAARADRIAAAQQRERTRLGDLVHARELRRKHGIRTASELFVELNSIISALAGCLAGSDLDGYRRKLVDMASDLEDDIVDPFAFDKREPREDLSRACGQRQASRELRS